MHQKFLSISSSFSGKSVTVTVGRRATQKISRDAAILGTTSVVNV